MATPHLSIVIPAYNEQNRLPVTLEKIHAYLKDKPFEAEVVVVDDGSRDRTAELSEEFGRTHSNVRTIRNPHKGKAFTVRTGLLSSEGKYILFTDVDLAVPIQQADVLLAEMERGNVQVCFGSREGRGATRIGEPWHRHVMGRVFNLVVRLLGVGDFQDTQCGFKGFEGRAGKEIFGRLKLYGEDAPVLKKGAVTAFDVEVLFVAKKLGFGLKEVPVEWHYGQESKVSPMSDSAAMFMDVCRVRWNAWRGLYDR